MRIKEIICEDYSQQLTSDLDNILIGAKGNGLQQIDMPQLVGVLQHMGYSVDVDSLIPMLQNNPAVMNATPDTVILTAPESVDNGGSEDDSADRVRDMAAAATKIG